MAKLILMIYLAYIANTSKWEKWHVIPKRAPHATGKQTVVIFFVTKRLNYFLFIFCRPPPCGDWRQKL